MKKPESRTKTSEGHRRGSSPRLADVISPRLFKALCDPNRIALLVRLSECGRPCGVTELGGCCEVDLSVTSRHLATLRDAGVLASTRRGKEIYYEVRAEELVRTLRTIADAIEGCCGCSATRAPHGKTRPAGRRNPPPARKERR